MKRMPLFYISASTFFVSFLVIGWLRLFIQHIDIIGILILSLVIDVMNRSLRLSTISAMSAMMKMPLNSCFIICVSFDGFDGSESSFCFSDH